MYCIVYSNGIHCDIFICVKYFDHILLLFIYTSFFPQVYVCSRLRTSHVYVGTRAQPQCGSSDTVHLSSFFEAKSLIGWFDWLPSVPRVPRDPPPPPLLPSQLNYRCIAHSPVHSGEGRKNAFVTELPASFQNVSEQVSLTERYMYKLRPG